MRIKNRIKTLLKLKKLSQRKLAKSIGITHMAVFRWCKNIYNPGDEYIEKLEEVLGVAKEDIFYLEINAPNSEKTYNTNARNSSASN